MDRRITVNDEEKPWHDSEPVVPGGESIFSMFNYQREGGPTVRLPAKCPECGEIGVHLVYYDFGSGSGGSWAWCSSCYGWGHGRAIIPKWWTNVPGIDMLTATPVDMDNARDRIDEHWNSLLDCTATAKPDHSQAVAAG